MITFNNNMNREKELLLWLDGVLDAVSNDDDLTEGGDHRIYVRIPRKTYEMICGRIKNFTDGKTENTNQELLRG